MHVFPSRIACLVALAAGFALKSLGPGWIPWLILLVLVNVVWFKALLFARKPGQWAGKHILNLGDAAGKLLLWMLAGSIARAAVELPGPYWEHIRQALADPLPLNAMEGRETVKAWLLTRGTNLYPSLDGHPFLVTIYPPLYHALVAAVSQVAGFGIATARLVSLGSFWVMALAAGAAVFAATRQWGAGVLVLLALLFDPVLSDWSLHARPDMTAWALAVLASGVFWAACSPDATRRRSDGLALGSGALFCLALFTKQQTLPWLLGSMLWAVFKGRRVWRPAVLTCLACLALGAGLSGVMELVTGGGFLRDTVFYPAAMGALPGVSTRDNLLARLGQIWETHRVVWSVFGMYLAWSAWKRRWDPPLVLALVNAAFMVKLLASWGADINYAFGTLAAAVMGLGLMAGELRRSRPYGKALAAAVFLLLLPGPSRHSSRGVPDLSGLTGLTGRILVNTEGGHLFDVDKPGRETVFFDGIETQLFERTGTWKSGGSALAGDIRRRAFDRLVFYGSFLPQAVQDAASIYYEPAGTIDHYRIFAPSKAACVAELDSSGGTHGSGGGEILDAGISTLTGQTEGMAPAKPGEPGILRFAVRCPEASSVEARLSLRVDPKDPAASATYRLEDGEGRVLAQSTASRDGRPDVSLKAGIPGEAAVLVVEVKGKAWIVPDRGALAVLKATRQ